MARKQTKENKADAGQNQEDQAVEAAAGMVTVTLNRVFKHWDGQQVNVYEPGENEMTEECARLAKRSGAVVPDEGGGEE